MSKDTSKDKSKVSDVVPEVEPIVAIPDPIQETPEMGKQIEMLAKKLQIEAEGYTPKRGDWGGYMNHRNEPDPAMVLRVNPPGTTDGAGKKTVKTTVNVVYFNDWVHSGNEQAFNVEIGKGKRQFWHSLSELEESIALERAARTARETAAASGHNRS